MRRRRAARLWFGAVLVTVLLAGWTFTYALEPVRVVSDSMSPTLRAGNQVLIDKLTRRAHHPRRRDVVILRLPGSDEQLIKRVVGLAGDTIALEDGELVVNGTRITEGFVDHSQLVSVYFGPVTVPNGSVFVLGDNRSNSIDSRTFGPVPARDIAGRVVFRLGSW